LFTEFSILFC